MRKLPAVYGRRRALARRNAADPETVKRLTKICNKNYPKVMSKPGTAVLTVVTFGITGATRNKRRNECLAAARAGKPDPRSKGQPAVLRESYRLWSIPEPWKDRPSDTAGNVFRAIGLKTGGDTLRSMAKGWKPPGKLELQELERKATILGGLMTLQALEVAPWTSVNLEQVPALKLKNDSSALPLLRAVQAGAKVEGRPAPATVKEASEYIRQRVIEHDAGGPAWQARAMHLSLAGTGATDKRANVESAVAMGTGFAAKGLYGAAAGAAGTIVGAPVGAVLGLVGGVLDGVSLGMTALSGRSKIESVRAEGEAKGYAQKFQQELEARVLRQQKELLEQQIKMAEAQRALEKEAARVEGERITKFVTAAVWVGVLGGAGFLTYAAVQAIRRRRAA